jgi:integrase
MSDERNREPFSSASETRNGSNTHAGTWRAFCDERATQHFGRVSAEGALNDLRVRCQCCAQGKDARRRNPKCCAIGLCCRQIASEWTRHQAWTVLQSALTAAVRDELVSRNVAALVKVPVPRAHRARVWTVEEARTFLESARAANDPFYAAYVLMLVLGLRRGEILGLAWSEVDLEAREALIAWQLQCSGPPASAGDQDGGIRCDAASSRNLRSRSGGSARTRGAIQVPG